MGIVGHAIAATLKHVSTLNSNSSSCKFRNARSKQHHSAFGHGLCSNLPANDDAAWCCDFAGLFHQQADVGNNCLTRRGLKSKSSESIYMRIKHVKHDETTYHILICVDSCNILAYCIILRTLLMPPPCESPLGSAWTDPGCNEIHDAYRYCDGRSYCPQLAGCYEELIRHQSPKMLGVIHVDTWYMALPCMYIYI